jgi:hypothetical protein
VTVAKVYVSSTIADLQTVGCSTFTRGAEPATRRAADGERMNPRRRVRVRANNQETMSPRATSL